MAIAPNREAVAEPSELGDSAAARPYLTASTAAWLCAIPCAVVVLVAILALGPLLGDLFSQRTYRFLAVYRAYVRPEPTEQARFLLALSAPLLLSLATIAASRRPPRLSPRLQARAVVAAQLALVALLAACFVIQHDVRYGLEYTMESGLIGWTYFTPATLVVAGAIAALLSIALPRIGASRRASRLLRESTARRVAATGAAVAMTLVWLLHAINSDHSVANVPWSVGYHLTFTFDEAFAVVNGLTPLVDFSAQYGSLWPYAGALSMVVFGKTLLVFTIAMCSITALALLAIFDVLRRVTRNALTALLLYLPFLATGLYKVRGTLLDRDTFATYLGAFPLRYAGPYLLAWLTARQLDRRGDRAGTWPLFVLAGLVMLNNLEYGFVALGASVAALLWTRRIDRRSLLRLAAAVCAGLATAFVLVSALTLARAGSLPRLWRLTDYAGLYARGGFAMLPIRSALGLHVVIYLTYVAAIATATVRALNHAANRVLTGMLAWSGVFGLGSGSYFAGRSHPEVLIASFSTWALALSLLTVVVISRLAAEPRRRPSIAAYAVLFGLGIAACSLAQTPAPWSQLARFDKPFAPTLGSTEDLPMVIPRERATERFVSSLADGPHRFVVKHGAPVAIFTAMGHRAADAYGIVDVSPYTGWNSMETEERVEAVLDALRDAGGNTAIVPRHVDPGLLLVLARHGFRVLTASGRLARFGPHHRVSNLRMLAWPQEEDQTTWLTKWVDTRHLHPRALAGG